MNSAMSRQIQLKTEVNPVFCNVLPNVVHRMLTKISLHLLSTVLLS